jgi:hypothetical protein
MINNKLFIISLLVFNIFSCEDNYFNIATFQIGGCIKNESNGDPILDCSITINDQIALSDSNGYFIFKKVNNGDNLIHFEHQNFNTYDTTIYIESNTSIIVYLTPQEKYLHKLEGIVQDKIGGFPINNCILSYRDNTIVTDSMGYFVMEKIYENEYSIHFKCENYNNLDTVISISSDTTILIELMPFYIDYFPLQKGNKWLYDYSLWYVSSSGRSSESGIVTMTVINNKDSIHTLNAKFDSDYSYDGWYPDAPDTSYHIDKTIEFEILEKDTFLYINNPQGSFLWMLYDSFSQTYLKKYYSSDINDSMIVLTSYYLGENLTVTIKRYIGIQKIYYHDLFSSWGAEKHLNMELKEYKLFK